MRQVIITMDEETYELWKAIPSGKKSKTIRDLMKNLNQEGKQTLQQTRLNFEKEMHKVLVEEVKLREKKEFLEKEYKIMEEKINEKIKQNKEKMDEKYEELKEWKKRIGAQ